MGPPQNKSAAKAKEKQPITPEVAAPPHKIDNDWLFFTIGSYAKGYKWARRNDKNLLDKLMDIVDNCRYVEGRESANVLKKRKQKWMNLLKAVAEEDWDEAVANPPKRPPITKGSVFAKENPEVMRKQREKRGRELFPEEELPSTPKKAKSSATVLSASTSHSSKSKEKEGLHAAKELEIELLDDIQHLSIKDLTADAENPERFGVLLESTVGEFLATPPSMWRNFKLPENTEKALRDLIAAANANAIKTAQQSYLAKKIQRLEAKQARTARKIDKLRNGEDTSEGEGDVPEKPVDHEFEQNQYDDDIMINDDVVNNDYQIELETVDMRKLPSTSSSGQPKPPTELKSLSSLSKIAPRAMSSKQIPSVLKRSSESSSESSSEDQSAQIGQFSYGENEDMKPFRHTQMNNLMLNCGLYKHMRIVEPPRATELQLRQFHSEGYISHMRDLRPADIVYPATQVQFDFGFGRDTKLFDGIYDYCQLVAGASIAAAAELGQGSDICINWSGGLHHGLPSAASGFCPINDVNLCILELLKSHPRVLYIDIDCHHGNGVEAAFCGTDRVLTTSFHKYGKRKNGEKFFPETGPLEAIGFGKTGKYYTVNVPLNDGLTDESLEFLFKPIVDSIIQRFNPTAIVLQCGADSLAGDSIGVFNLTTKGHGACVEYIKRKNLPLVLLGGGGYNLENVSRLWTYETSIAVGVGLADNIPKHDYWLNYASDDFKLHTTMNPEIVNDNSTAYLNDVRGKVMENLSHINTPSVAFHEPQPRTFEFASDESMEEA